ncbi:hypothetical protein QYF61_003040 [Mycteria americana]|uniref:Uncharacterized protein n=1 Tax=Mycteria americana TaxID=33587 RepID=A0AAN7S9B9_MYCAM|nr:hypothetical protein QYF61_003040 [Mycteria americana]
MQRCREGQNKINFAIALVGFILTMTITFPFKEWLEVRTAACRNGGRDASSYELKCAWAKNTRLDSEVPKFIPSRPLWCIPFAAGYSSRFQGFKLALSLLLPLGSLEERPEHFTYLESVLEKVQGLCPAVRQLACFYSTSPKELLRCQRYLPVFQVNHVNYELHKYLECSDWLPTKAEMRGNMKFIVHKKLGGDTARTADPNWPKGYSIPYGIMRSIETGRSWPGHSDRCSGTGCASYRFLEYVYLGKGVFKEDSSIFFYMLQYEFQASVAKQPQFPQPLPISLVLQTLHQLRCPSLDTLQPLNVSLVDLCFHSFIRVEVILAMNKIRDKIVSIIIEVKFPNIQSKPPLVQLEAISSCPITCYLGEETDPHLSTTSFQYLIQTSFKYLQGWRLNHFPGQSVPMLDNPLGEEKFPNIQSKPPLAQLEAISSHPITCYLGEETDPHLSTTSFQVVVESDEVSPQPPFLQAKQSQLPQPLLIRLLLQTLHQLRCPSLYALQYLNIPLVVGGPKLNTVFEVWPHQCRVQGHNHFPSPAGHAIFDAGQDAIGLLGRLGTLLAHIQAAAAFQPLFPKPVALHGVAVAQVQDLALGLVKPHTIHPSPSIQPVQVPLQSLPTLQQINTPTQLGVICKLTEGALDPFVQIIDKDVKQNWPQHRALGNTACDRPPTGVNSIHHHSLGPAVQPVLYPAKSTPVQAMSSQFLQENAAPRGLVGLPSSLGFIPSGAEIPISTSSVDTDGSDDSPKSLGWRLNHFPGQPVPTLDNPCSEVKFPNIQSKPPLAQLGAISSCPITCYLGEETDPTSLQPPFRQL